MILWSRSPWERGNHCPRARWWEYHAGGSGITPKASPIPLAEGIAVHEIMEGLLRACTEVRPDQELAEIIITSKGDEFEAKAREGLEGVTGAQLDHVIKEQRWLAECLGWAAWRWYLPQLLSEYDLVAIEQEETWVAGCDCGIGDGEGEVGVVPKVGMVHIPAVGEIGLNPCNGIIIMSRPDFEVRRKSDGALAIMDWKTSGYSMSTREFEHKIQIAVGTLGVERRLGEPVTHYWLVGLIKGQRGWLTKEEQEGGFKKQIHPVCYPWVKQADPPFTGLEIQFSGTTKKGFSRKPAWELGFSAMEWMLSQVPPEISEAMIQPVGPFAVPKEILGGFLTQVVQGAREWAARVENVVQGGHSLDTMIYQTWDCLPYGPNASACSYLGICKGWESLRDPVGSGQFVARKGNHALEKEWLGEGR